MQQPVLIVGLFTKKENKNNVYITAADQLAQLLAKNKIPVLTTSYQRGKFLRMADTLLAIIRHQKKIQLAVLPLYGTKPSFTWQEISAGLLKIFRKKIILVVHGGSIPQRMQQNAKPFLKALHRADLVVCPSAYLQHILRGYQVQSTVIENVLNLAEYSFTQKKNIRPRLIWMRAFEDVYNPQMAVRVAALLYKKYPGFKMVMAGSDKGLLGEVERMIKNENLQEVILTPGYIDLEQKKYYAHAYDIFICTNYIDNAPVSLIEFMALGVPIVSVNTGGIPYLITDGENGLLVNSDDAAAMVNQVEKLLQSPQLVEKITLNAYHYSRQFDENAVMEKWQQVFDQFN